MGNNAIDIELLLKLRLVVARFGEMDLAKWWNTKGQLGNLGSMALRRGFPRTYHFAQARSVFAVAANRCKEVFNPPGCATLWHLPEVIEDEFETNWERWLDSVSGWQPFFKNLGSIQGQDLVSILRNFDVATDRDIQILTQLKLSAEGRAIQLPSVFSARNEDLIQLALGFSLGESGTLAVPYMRCS